MSKNIDIDELLQLLQKLITIDSVNPSLVDSGNGEYDIALYTGKYMSEMGLEVFYQSIEKNRSNVIGILKGTGKGKSLMLNGHTDTVGIGGMKKPFNPHLTDGRVHGRGALDMKGGLASILMAVRSIIQSNIELRGDLIVAFVIDEEYESIGTEALLKEYTADAAIVTEPTNMQIAISHKGFAWIKIEVFGKAAHGSLINEGVDAIVKAGKVLLELENLQQELNHKNHPLLGSPSVHASLITGGSELSTYPDYCKIEVERRTIPGEDRETVETEMKEIIERIKTRDDQFKARFEVFFDRSPLEVPIDVDIVKSLQKATDKESKGSSDLVGITYWTDAALLTDAGIPTVLIGPKGEGLHAAVEYVEFNSVITLTKMLINTILDFCEY